VRSRFIIWRGVDDWRAEASEIELGDDGLRAAGVQLGVVPHRYRLAYRLDATAPGFGTRSLDLEAVGHGWTRTLRLTRDDHGLWRTEHGADGEVDMPPPRADTGELTAALDCDLAFSPLTNTMPIRRHRLNEQAGSETLLMAWVSVPDLSVTPSRQHYAHVTRRSFGAAVRYESESRDFVAELEVDDAGVVTRYPGLAEQV
jgi:hypothetical protein